MSFWLKIPDYLSVSVFSSSDSFSILYISLIDFLFDIDVWKKVLKIL